MRSPADVAEVPKGEVGFLVRLTGFHLEATLRRNTAETASIVCEKRGIPMVLFLTYGSSRTKARVDIAEDMARFADSLRAVESGREVLELIARKARELDWNFAK
jgi:hypothetical protein